MLDSIYHAFLSRVRKDGTLPQSDRLLACLLFNLCAEMQSASHIPVRDLGEAVHISTAAVNDGIERLKNAGYIQAELRRKKRPKERRKADDTEDMEEYGKELWHISFPELVAFSAVIHQEVIVDQVIFHIYAVKRT